MTPGDPEERRAPAPYLAYRSPLSVQRRQSVRAESRAAEKLLAMAEDSSEEEEEEEFTAIYFTLRCQGLLPRFSMPCVHL